MTVTFPCVFLGAETDVTLALVVPDVRPGQAPVLIGMNTLEPLCGQHTASEFSHFQPMAQGYRAVLKLLQLRYQQGCSDSKVRLASKPPVSIPAGHTTVLEGSVYVAMTVNQ